jgi:ribosomal protein S18 acetylase RimI-like enzyme
MRIRQATDADLDAILRIVRLVVPLMQAAGNRQWADDYPDRETFALDIANGELWVAELEAKLAAVVAICGEQSPEYADVGWDLSEPALVVHRLAVDPAFRSRGVAMALMQHAEELARAQNIPQIRLDTNTTNLAVQKLLDKLGYVYAGEIGLLRRPGLRFRCYDKSLSVHSDDLPPADPEARSSLS